MRVEIGKYIVIDSEICHGKPTFKGTRVLVRDVLELISAGVTPKKIIREYYPRITEKMIKEALELAAAIIGEEYVKISFGRKYPQIA